MDTNNSKLQPVQVDWDEIEKRVREQRIKTRKRILLVIIVIAAVIAFLLVARHFRTYTDYRVLSSSERQDTDATGFLTFGENAVRYSNDGASCTDAQNRSLWNVSYEMSSPIAETSSDYLAIADQGGKTLEVIDKSGSMRTINTDLPIIRIDVADNGSAAVMMEENDVCYLTVYNRSGRRIANGEFHDEGGGYPLDIALSSDGENLAVSSMDISSGNSSSTLSFYNFGSAGQDKENNLITEKKYSGTVIPDITYKNGRLIAFGTDKVMLFRGTSEPKRVRTISVSDGNQIKAVVYNEDYFGLLLTQDSESSGNELDIYSTAGKEISGISTNAQYSSLGFVNNNKEIYLSNGGLCAIYTIRGHCKYHGTSDADVENVLQAGRFRRYMFIEQGKTEIVRLKGFRHTD